jgi:hypothetical protein
MLHCLAVSLSFWCASSAGNCFGLIDQHSATVPRLLATAREPWLWLWQDDAATRHETRQRDCVCPPADPKVGTRFLVAQPSLDRIRSDPVPCWVGAFDRVLAKPKIRISIAERRVGGREGNGTGDTGYARTRLVDRSAANLEETL